MGEGGGTVGRIVPSLKSSVLEMAIICTVVIKIKPATVLSVCRVNNFLIQLFVLLHLFLVSYVLDKSCSQVCSLLIKIASV